jgi:hypothetical protein
MIANIPRIAPPNQAENREWARMDAKVADWREGGLSVEGVIDFDDIDLGVVVSSQ